MPLLAPRARLRNLDLGGGFAAFSDEGSARALFREIGEAFADRFPGTELLVEPGRYLVDSAAWVVARVVDTKTEGDLTYLVTDAGTNTLMPFREASYSLDAAPGPHRVCVVDGITSLTSTIIAETGVARPPRRGERILLSRCGAYTTAMSQFWVYDPLPVAFLDRAGTLQEDLPQETIAECRRLLLGI